MNKLLRNHLYIHALLIFSSYSSTYPAWSWKKMLPMTSQEELVTSSHTLEPAYSLIVQGIQGSISIKGSTRNTLEVSATKKGIEEELPLTTIESKISDGTATVKTIQKDAAHPIHVHYKIVVPQKLSKITVISDNGPVTVTDCDAPVDVTTVAGDIIVRDGRMSINAKCTERGSITIEQVNLPSSAMIFAETMRGNVDLTLPKKVNATLNAHTLKGTLTCTIPVTLESRTTVLTKETWARLMREAHGTLGSTSSGTSSAPITIDVTKGNISIKGKVG
jgi:DUF4097 and DUF4098 domain-containing protein YvlB